MGYVPPEQKKLLLELRDCTTIYLRERSNTKQRGSLEKKKHKLKIARYRLRLCELRYDIELCKRGFGKGSKE